MVAASAPGSEVNAWDLCHHLVSKGFGAAGAAVEFAEPDLEQSWIAGTDAGHALALTRPCNIPAGPDKDLPNLPDFYWFHDANHSQLESARAEIGNPANNRVLIAHLDTGYDPAHKSIPPNLQHQLERNFVDANRPKDASDDSSGLITNLGHGTGTLSILAGSDVEGSALGGATWLDVVPIRVANAVVIFKTSAVARAFDYVHKLTTRTRRVHVVTMSMGGLASQAWAEAVNTLYDQGIFVVTAAGNNYFNLPTHHIVYPARFKRVVAACGVMEDGSPYADLPMKKMAGNYGPSSKMATAIAGCTPNTPWARFGCPDTIDHDGCGTSAATPQIAASAALWAQKYVDKLDKYSQGWMRVEAIRKALFDSAHLDNPDLAARLGRGMVRAQGALELAPASEAQLRDSMQPEDSASFEFLRVLTGLGAAAPTSSQRMLELEALQLTQGSQELERMLPDPGTGASTMTVEERRRFADALIAQPGASKALRSFLAPHGSGVQGTAAGAAVQVPPVDQQRLQRAMTPPQPKPAKRRLKVFAFDPLLAGRLETQHLNETVLEVSWENLGAGPKGEYLEVVDVDPATGVCYAPVDLDQPFPLSQSGLSPSEANPQFHQQMVYAVAMTTIAHFERALGRVALWSPRRVQVSKDPQRKYVKRLRIYPHALREANAYYSPEKKALLFGYFAASSSQPGENLPGGMVFGCLSHDIVAHETTHALLDGLHPYFQEFTNPDVPAFHEAFADIVALFQHFTIPDALRDQIAETQGNLGKQNLLGDLAQQFGQATEHLKALRSAIGSDQKYDPDAEAHDLGAVLVAAVFDAFLSIYKSRSEDLLRLATGGTGILPAGAIPHDLVNRLAREASKTAAQVLNMCIRALDYCPPVDITFGEYLRALITADRDVMPDDSRSYRVAFIDAFRRRGIYPQGVRNLSSEALCWEVPELAWDLTTALSKMTLTWDLSANRERAFESSKSNQAALSQWIKQKPAEEQQSLGFYPPSVTTLTVDGRSGRITPFEVHSLRPVRRVGPDGQVHLDVVVEITQKWIPNGQDAVYRGGCTLLISLANGRIKYCVRKRVAHRDRIAVQQGFRAAGESSSLRQNYYDIYRNLREPFAMLHRGA